MYKKLSQLSNIKTQPKYKLAKYLNEKFQRRYNVSSKHMKRYSVSLLLESCKLKLYEWLKLKRLTISSVGEV